MDLWNKCSKKLENRMSQEDFNTWIRPLKATINKDKMELVAPNDFILDYIEKNFAEEISRTVKSQTKNSISLVFKTHTKETFVDKYQKSKSSGAKLVENYTFIVLLKENQITWHCCRKTGCCQSKGRL